MYCGMTGVCASISQLLDWNADPFGQDVQQVLTNNILKNEDDPMVNGDDIAPTAHSLSKGVVSLFSLKNSSFPSRLKDFSFELKLFIRKFQSCLI